MRASDYQSAASEHERGLAAFVASPYRKRFREALKTPKLRDRLRARFAHTNYLDPRFANRLTSGNRSVPAILTSLRQRGAPDKCHIFSENDDIDGREMEIDDAIAAIHSRGWGTFVSCLPGKLAYFEDEHGERHLLEHP